jgi:hypothetical protein
MRIGKCEIGEYLGKLELEMPYSASVLHMIFSVVSLFLSGAFACYVIFGSDAPALIKIPVIGIFMVAIVYLFDAFWRQEKVTITSRSIYIEHCSFGFSSVGKRYSVNQIQGLFISSVFDELPKYRGDEHSEYYRGRIGFNIDKKFWGSRITIRFGSCLEQDEARQILQVIFEHFPQYQRKPKRVKTKLEEK